VRLERYLRDKIDSTGGNVVYSTYVGGSGSIAAMVWRLMPAAMHTWLAVVGDTSIDFRPRPARWRQPIAAATFDGVVFKLMRRATP